jgi:hypothetical protein
MNLAHRIYTVLHLDLHPRECEWGKIRFKNYHGLGALEMSKQNPDCKSQPGFCAGALSRFCLGVSYMVCVACACFLLL